MRKVYVTVTVGLIVQCDESVDVCEVIDEMDYDFTSNHPNATIILSDVRDYEVTDSK